MDTFKSVNKDYECMKYVENIIINWNLRIYYTTIGFTPYNIPKYIKIKNKNNLNKKLS